MAAGNSGILLALIFCCLKQSLKIDTSLILIGSEDVILRDSWCYNLGSHPTHRISFSHVQLCCALLSPTGVCECQSHGTSNVSKLKFQMSTVRLLSINEMLITYRELFYGNIHPCLSPSATTRPKCPCLIFDNIERTLRQSLVTFARGCISSVVTSLHLCISVVTTGGCIPLVFSGSHSQPGRAG